MSGQLSRREFMKLMGLFPLLAIRGSERTFSTNPDAPNILFLVFDTLSAKHISMFGYPRDTMPNLAKFAERATVFNQHYSGGSFTTPGTASILTGMYPFNHRAFQPYGTVKQDYADRNLFTLFNQAGYHTQSFSQNLLVNILVDQFIEGVSEYVPPARLALAAKEFADDFFTRDYGLAVQAERRYLNPVGQYPNSLFLSLVSKYYEDQLRKGLRKDTKDDFPRGLPQNHDIFYILEDVVDWGLDRYPAMQQPFLSYMHVMPPHDPYNPRADFIGRYADQPANNPVKPTHFFDEDRDQKFLDKKREQYDEYIAYVDAEFGRLIDGLEAQGALENTWVVFGSDHGELFERGIYRHITPVLYEPVIRVPLLMRAPGQSERVDVHTPTSNVDILPTLLHLTGQQIPAGLDGKVLPPWGMTDPERVIFAADAKSNPKLGPLNKGTITAIQNQHKLVHYFGYGGYESEYEYFDLSRDPEELDNRYSSSDKLIQNLSDQIQSARGLS